MVAPKNKVRQKPGTWTIKQVLALPLMVDLITAGSVVGLSRTATYDALNNVADTELPFPVRRVGGRWKVARNALLLALGADAEGNSIRADVA
jgi:hypothetical protein